MCIYENVPSYPVHFFFVIRGMYMDQELKLLIKGQHYDALIAYVSRLQPYDFSEKLLLCDLEDQITLFSILPTSIGVGVFEYLKPELQYRILDHMNETPVSELLNAMSSDNIVDLLLAIHPNQADRLINFLPSDYKEKISTLMNFSAESAGSLATVDYISARDTWTPEQTIQHIRKIGREAEIVSYIYVLDMHGKLAGIVSLKEIILADSETILEDIMKQDIVTVPADMNQQEVAAILSAYDLVAIPVVTPDHRLIGIITVDDLIDVINEEATEDIHRLGGSQPLEKPYFDNSVWQLFRKRIGWLLILFIAEAYTGNVLRHYEETLDKVVALAFFIPLLIGTGGNSGTQIVTTLVRALGIGEVKSKDIFKVIRKELTTGILISFSMGIIAFIRAQILGVGFDIGSVVAITAIFIVIWASLVAAALPFILNKFKVDPAVVSGPFITTLVDGTGLIIYFTLARILLDLH